MSIPEISSNLPIYPQESINPVKKAENSTPTREIVVKIAKVVAQLAIAIIASVLIGGLSANPIGVGIAVGVASFGVGVLLSKAGGQAMIAIKSSMETAMVAMKKFSHEGEIFTPFHHAPGITKDRVFTIN